MERTDNKKWLKKLGLEEDKEPKTVGDYARVLDIYISTYEGFTDKPVIDELEWGFFDADSVKCSREEFVTGLESSKIYEESNVRISANKLFLCPEEVSEIREHWRTLVTVIPEYVLPRCNIVIDFEDYNSMIWQLNEMSKEDRNRYLGCLKFEFEMLKEAMKNTAEFQGNIEIGTKDLKGLREFEIETINEAIEKNRVTAMDKLVVKKLEESISQLDKMLQQDAFDIQELGQMYEETQYLVGPIARQYVDVVAMKKRNQEVLIEEETESFEEGTLVEIQVQEKQVDHDLQAINEETSIEETHTILSKFKAFCSNIINKIKPKDKEEEK